MERLSNYFSNVSRNEVDAILLTPSHGKHSRNATTRPDDLKRSPLLELHGELLNKIMKDAYGQSFKEATQISKQMTTNIDKQIPMRIKLDVIQMLSNKKIFKEMKHFFDLRPDFKFHIELHNAPILQRGTYCNPKKKQMYT